MARNGCPGWDRTSFSVLANAILAATCENAGDAGATHGTQKLKDLTEVIAAWSSLASEVRAAIALMVRMSAPRCEGVAAAARTEIEGSERTALAAGEREGAHDAGAQAGRPRGSEDARASVSNSPLQSDSDAHQREKGGGQ